MRFLSLTEDSQIERSSYSRYQNHLDDIRDSLPEALFEMLRFPEAAYRSGKTFYDSTVVEWSDVPNPAGEHLVARILSPHHDWEFRFKLMKPLLHDATGTRRCVGELLCLEVTRLQSEGYSLCFMYITREELKVECQQFDFEQIPL